MGSSIKSLALLTIALSPCAFSQAGLVGTKSTAGAIHFQAVEDFQIEGGHRVRLMPVTTQRVGPEDAKRFPREELTQTGAIRGDANHLLVRVDDLGKPTDIILPDSFAPKTPLDAPMAQGRLLLQAFQSKKNKSGEMIAPESFFVYVPGAEADRLALNLIRRESFFLNSDEQLAAMKGFVESFPDSPLKPELRSEIQARIENGLAAFDDRGPFDALLSTRRFAALATRLFPGDAPLGAVVAKLAERIRMIESSRLALQSLAAAGEWDRLLEVYVPFERNQWSFPEMMALRQTALEESARLHAHRANLLEERQLHADALKEYRLAAQRDPANRETAKLMETTRIVGSLAEASTAKRSIMVPGTPQELRFRRAVHDAERAVQDRDFAKAETALQEARTENKDAPELLLLQAKLLAARDRHAEAIPLLDAYDRIMPDAGAREAGNAARNDILYDVEKKRAAFREQLQKLQQDGEYSKLRAAVSQALTLDPDDPDFLYYSGMTAALFRDPPAKERLDRYLLRSNSLAADPQARDRALRIRALLEEPLKPPVKPTAGTPNWFSGRNLPEGTFYDPLSAAFQPPIDSIAGYKLKMNFEWDGPRLLSIATTFDDDKGSQNYHSMGGPADSQGNFFFAYPGNSAQVQFASSRRIDPPGAATELRVAHNPSHLVEEHGTPRVFLQESDQFNPAVLGVLEGSLSIGVAGNSYLNPFIWDGLHYFSFSYDKQGFLSSAREWNTDNVVRFTWTSGRLTEVRAFRKDSPTFYYQRVISYSGPMITSESYSTGTKTGQIKYVYSGRNLVQVKVDDSGVHDGRSWTVKLR